MRDPNRDLYIVGENGYLICKAHVGERIVYTLSHRGELVVSGDLALCKERADEDSRSV
jgi:hypothetical protein